MSAVLLSHKYTVFLLLLFVPGTLFCNKLTTVQYERQQRDCTERAIVSLVRTVIDDTNLSLKDKQKQIKLYKKHHPGIMAKHFSDI